MCCAGLIEFGFGSRVAIGRVLDEFDAGVAGVEMDELGARPLDTDASLETVTLASSHALWRASV